MAQEIFTESLITDFKAGKREFGFKAYKDKNGRLCLWIGQEDGAGFLFVKFDDGMEVTKTSRLDKSGFPAPGSAVSAHHAQIAQISGHLPLLFTLFERPAPEDERWSVAAHGLARLMLQKAIACGPTFGQCSAG